MSKKLEIYFSPRMKKVGRLHFALTLFVFLVLLVPAMSKGHRFEQPDPMRLAWMQFGILALIFLQPLAVLSFAKLLPLVGNHLGLFQQDWLGATITYIFLIVSFLSIPSWSVFFGWGFVKLDDWLNHFPVLGRRVL